MLDVERDALVRQVTKVLHRKYRSFASNGLAMLKHGYLSAAAYSEFLGLAASVGRSTDSSLR